MGQGIVAHWHLPVYMETCMKQHYCSPLTCSIRQGHSFSWQHIAGGAGVQGSSVQPDPEIVTQLMGMGFSENGSKRAAVATKVSLLWLPCLLLHWLLQCPLLSCESLSGCTEVAMQCCADCVRANSRSTLRLTC